MDVFVSVGSRLSSEQEQFVTALEAKLAQKGLRPRTLDRNAWSTRAPLEAVGELMDGCYGAVIVGLERYYFPEGIERRGAESEQSLGRTALPTSWNQVEAALAYSRNLPLFVVVDENVKATALLEHSHNWFVAKIKVEVAALATAQFNGLLEDWCSKVASAAPKGQAAGPSTQSQLAGEISKLSLTDLIGLLRPGEAWKAIAVSGAVVLATFTAGLKVAPLLDKPPPAPVVTKSSPEPRLPPSTSESDAANPNAGAPQKLP